MTIEDAAREVVRVFDKGDDPDENYPCITALKEALARAALAGREEQGGR